MKTRILTFLILVFSGIILFAQEYKPNWESLDKRSIPPWFQDAKFGIFIHWGLYSVPAWRKVSTGRYASYADWYYARVMFDKENGGEEFHNKNYGKDFQYRDFAPLFRAELFDPDLWADLFTRKKNNLYVLYTSWPQEVFKIAGIKAQDGTEVSLLNLRLLIPLPFLANMPGFLKSA